MKKYIGVALGVLIALSLVLSGCSKQNKNAADTTLTGTSTDVYGKVTAIDGSTISVDVVTIPGMSDMGSGQQSAPEIPSGDFSQGDVPEMPNDDNGQQGMPEMTGDAGGQQTPPEMPNGEMQTDGSQLNQPNNPNNEMPNGDTSQQTPPEKPDGEGNLQMPEMTGDAGEQQSLPEMGDMTGFNMSLTSTGETGTITINDTSILFKNDSNKEVSADIADIARDQILKITFDESGVVSKIVIYNENELFAGGGNNGDMGGGQGSAPTDYNAVNEYSEDTTISNETFTSTGKDESDILVTNGTVSIDKSTITRTSSDSTGGDNSSFYGVGAAALATGGTLKISNSTITTDAAGGAGVFSYGNSVVTVSDTKISTTQGTSGGIHVAGGGTLYASNLDVVTNGASAAAIRSDRGGGTMIVNGGTYTSNGTGSPAIYCTADIAVKDSILTATNSEAICIEGKNSLKLYNCELTGNMPDQQANDSTWTVIVYQSMSGDAEIGSGSFEMIGGNLISKNGGLFYTTNTTSHILLKGVNIKASDDSEYLLACLGNNNSRGWGSSGKNGAECTFTAISQSMNGKVLWDSVSKLNFYLTEKSVLTGSFIQDESYAGNGGSGFANVYIDSNSKWIVNGNSTVTNLYNAGYIVDESGNNVSIVGTDGTKYVEGSSNYTITVNNYEAQADISGSDVPTAESSIEF